MRNIDYRLIVAIAIAVAAHIYLGQQPEADLSGRPSWPTSVQQLLRSA
jgi:hypothetical protein